MSERTWRDYMPEHDKQLAEQHPGYADAWRATMAGNAAELRAQMFNLGETLANHHPIFRGARALLRKVGLTEDSQP